MSEAIPVTPVSGHTLATICPFVSSCIEYSYSFSNKVWVLVGKESGLICNDIVISVVGAVYWTPESDTESSVPSNTIVFPAKPSLVCTAEPETVIYPDWVSAPAASLFLYNTFWSGL